MVKACPGSGKTLSVTARLDSLLSTWPTPNQGIATISFTNVAWQEIQRNLIEKFGHTSSLNYPHFLGTIDSFINRYIFLPFGHLVMKCTGRPKLIGEPHNKFEPIGKIASWGKPECNKTCRLNDFTYNCNNEIRCINPKNGTFKKCPYNKDVCLKKKRQIIRMGYATQSDANYYSLKILRDYPDIAKAIIERFPHLIIDEAQDSSEIQWSIFTNLIDNGLKNILFIGDPNQSIFEFHSARPDLFNKVYSNFRNNSFMMNENWRSSQKICDFYRRISKAQLTALHPDFKDIDIKPILYYAKNQEYEKIINKFLDHCRRESIEITPEQVAIIVRSNKLVSEIDERKELKGTPWRDENKEAGEIAESKFRYDNGDIVESFHLIQKAIYKIMSNQKYCNISILNQFIKKNGFVKWRTIVYDLLINLPSTHGKRLLEWKNEANNILEKMKRKYRLEIKNKYSDLLLYDLFQHSALRSKYPCTLSTIHGIKGKTFEAVLIILKSKAANSKQYKKILYESIEDSEELRNLYVAFSRPRKILSIAVPESDYNTWNQFFNL